MLARRLNEFTWDYHQKIPSRLGIRKYTKDSETNNVLQILKLIGKTFASLRLERLLEYYVERFISEDVRSSEARERLIALRPDCIVSMSPFWFFEPAVISEAKKLGMPVIGNISSWDNISTKNRLVYKYDGYMVWSEEMKRQLLLYYPDSRSKPVEITGAPQFDVFFQERFYQTKEEFCKEFDLDPNLPIILYAIGSPNFIKHEGTGAIEFVKRVERGELGNVQVIVRPHPIHDNGGFKEFFDQCKSKVVLQSYASNNARVEARTMDNQRIKQWVNTFRYADVVIQLSSTVAIDAAFFDKPVVNVDFDPDEEKKQEDLIRDINHKWIHFAPIAHSGGLNNVTNYEKMIEAVKTYLQHPGLHTDKRRWMKEFVSGYADGRNGERLANAITELANQF
jgi:hypothetical protein